MSGAPTGAPASIDSGAPETAEGGSSTTAERWVAGFAEGWRAPVDADSFADHFERLLSPEIRLVQPQLPVVVGHRAFRERFARPLFELVGDLHATVESWAADGNVIFIEILFEATLGGRPLRWRGVDRITLRDGLAVERIAFFDPAPVLAAVATRPRAWPGFARLQARSLAGRLRGRSSR